MGLSLLKTYANFVGLQSLCFEAHDHALKAFVNKDIGLAENVRNMNEKIAIVSSDIEKIAKNQPIEVMPQILAAASFLRRVYEYSVDLADLVV